MQIKIKRYHVALGMCLAVLLTAVGIFSRESGSSLKKAMEVPLDISSKTGGPVRKESASVPVPVHSPLDAKISKPAVKSVKKKNKAAVNAFSHLKNIALTFDDGPHPVYTERLLKILHDCNVPATFFVVGKQVELHPELLQKIFQEGHEIANHTYSHRDIRTLSPDEFADELDKTHVLVQAITEQKMKFFRPPGGQYNSDLVDFAKNRGYQIVLWTSFPQDHARPSPALIKNRVLSSAQENGIILLHSGIENTLTALPELITSLRNEGYSFVTVSQLQSQKNLVFTGGKKAVAPTISSLSHPAHLPR